MLNFLLDIVPKPDGNYYFDNFGEALVYALIGFLVVFCGIILIICIIYLLGFIFKKTNNLAFLGKWGQKIKQFFSKIAGKFKKKKPIQCEDKEFTETDDIDAELKAAIIAAVMAYYSNEKPECEFRVKRIKRI